LGDISNAFKLLVTWYLVLTVTVRTMHFAV